MHAVVEYLIRLPHEVREVGGSLPGRIVVLVLVLAANIGFYLPSIPAGTPGAGVPGLDKVAHLVVLALTVWAAGRLLAPRLRFPMGWVVIVALIHALLIELVQLLLLPQRGAEGADILFDVIGIALGVGLWIGGRLRHERSDRVEDDLEELEELEGAAYSSPPHGGDPRSRREHPVSHPGRP